MSQKTLLSTCSFFKKVAKIDAQSENALYNLVKKLAEEYSDFNAFLGYLLKIYSNKDSERDIRIRACLLTIRSSFIACVEELSRFTSTATPGKPYFSLLPQFLYHASIVEPYLKTIEEQYQELRSLFANEPETAKKVVEGLGEVLRSIEQTFDAIGKA